MRKGFTLIELLVVIAIIAILAAILFPVFAQAREKARQSACLSNVKEISLAIHMYAQDYDETLCRYYQSSNYYMPDEVLDPYIKNFEIWVCPSRSTFLHSTCGTHPPETVRGLRTNRPFSYAYNNFTESYGEVNGIAGSQYLGASGRALAYIFHPAETILIGDGVCERFWGVPFVDRFNNPDSYPTYPKHSDGSNFGYADGHAKWVKAGALRYYMFDCERQVATY
jgi:prepilin-type N-terminal cleavage/methylation domain-containing protein/prepilin-type processing-associated H-X9-DG protein